MSLLVKMAEKACAGFSGATAASPVLVLRLSVPKNNVQGATAAVPQAGPSQPNGKARDNCSVWGITNYSAGAAVWRTLIPARETASPPGSFHQPGGSSRRSSWC